MRSGCLETEQAAAPLPDRFVVRYVKWLSSRHGSLLALWALVSVILFVFGATRLMSLTRNEFDPPQGSASQVARELMRYHFPGFGAMHTDIVYFEVTEGHSVFKGSLLQDVFAAVNEAFRDLLAEDLYANLSVTGYVSAVARGLPPAAARAQFVSEHNSSSFLVVQYPKKNTMKYGHALQDCLLRLRSQRSLAFDQVSFVGGGGNALQSVEAVDEGSKSMGRMDLFSVPLAFAIFGLSLNSMRLLVLPLLTLILGYIAAFGFLGLLASMGLSVSSATPPFMMSMLLAVSIDYALFLLTRFKEEVDAGATADAAVTQMLLHSGHTVCGSGFTLALCFLALLLFPAHCMQSIGVGVIVSILAAILVNLTVIPAALLACPKFFANSSVLSLGCRGCRRNASDGDHAICSSTTNSRSFRWHNTSMTADMTRSQTSAWRRWSLFATSSKAAVLVLSILVLVGVLSANRCKSMKHSMDTWLLAPRISISLETFGHFSRSFSVGRTSAFQLLLLPDLSNSSSCSSSLIGSTGFYSEAFWTNATALLQGVVAELYDSSSREIANGESAKAQGMLHSIMYVYNMLGNGFQSSPANHAQPSASSLPMKYALFLDPNAPQHKGSRRICNSAAIVLTRLSGACHHFLTTKNCEDLRPLASIIARKINVPRAAVPDVCRAFQSELRSSATSNRDAVYATLVPAVLDRSKESVDWTRRCRKFLEANAEKYPCLTAHLNGITPQMMDTIDSIYSQAPPILVLTVGVCLLLVTFLTVSLAFGVSSVALIGWTLLVVFATGDVVYRGNLLEGVTVLQGTGGLAWIVPPLTASMIFGLGLDYNIFLLGRVCEYHCAGLSDREALARGVEKTGPVINSAGLIMAVAFSGLMLSDIPMLNQVSFLLVTAVLIDTFFVRCLATPALHTPLKSWNWWPRGAFDR